MWAEETYLYPVAKLCEKKRNTNDWRYPRICTLFQGYWKFLTFCKYDHRNIKDIVINNEKIKDLEKEMEDLQAKN